jgi:hypothetical protein
MVVTPPLLFVEDLSSVIALIPLYHWSAGTGSQTQCVERRQLPEQVMELVGSDGNPKDILG